MKRKISALTVVLVLVSTVSTFAWINSLTRASMTISMKNDASSNITIASTKAGTYGSSVAAANSFSIAPCVSNDGIIFLDEENNASSEYAQLLFYVKGDKDYNSLYVDAVTISPAAVGLKVAVEYDSLATILNTTSFTRTSLNRAVTTTAKAVKIRAWFDGNTVTEPISGDITITVDFSAE